MTFEQKHTHTHTKIYKRGLTDTLQQLRVAVVWEERRLKPPEVELQHTSHGVQVTLTV